ncbi:hypothetical protein TPE_1564 [Treponema pedis str. T A4]|uniref:Uncharacterized protein n=1 Tax=Treponema pedis str. T A4 TaxID=1291379 RepID=S6A8L9_9SPIR|nr:hypothetical protein TPE_1564 [Treponema pedis str. T A4]
MQRPYLFFAVNRLNLKEKYCIFINQDWVKLIKLIKFKNPQREILRVLQ